MTLPADITEALRKFSRALPDRARKILPLDHRVRAAIRVCAQRGDDMAQLAARCAAGTERRSSHDMRGLMLMRLYRAAGIDETEGDD